MSAQFSTPVKLLVGTFFLFTSKAGTVVFGLRVLKIWSLEATPVFSLNIGVKSQPYQAEISTVIMHTLAALDDVRIDRIIRDSNGKQTGIEKKLDVPIKYSQKTRTLAELVQVNGQHSFPAMALSLNGVGRDPERLRNKDNQHQIKSIDPDGGYTTIHEPVPIVLNMTLDIVAVYEEDLHQILNNFIAYFNPYITISWKEPFSGQELKTKVVWDGSASYEATTPLPSDIKDVYRSSLPLRVESWIFR